ncbi:MAG: serine/threonine-protein kinase [Myxococcota bacterium]
MVDFDPFNDDEPDEDATTLDAGLGGGVDLPHYPALARWGSFDILGRIARGGMAEVYLAREGSADGRPRHRVLKRILPDRENDAEFIRMFRAEAAIATRLYHPNICHVYEFGTHQGQTFMTLEFVHGVTLRKLLVRLRRTGDLLDGRLAAHIFAQIASALNYVHGAKDVHGRQLNIIHRDVSPHNVMIAYDGSVKLLDFGIAKTSAIDNQTRAGVIKGKFGYLAPEQVRGKQFDPRVDQFALGVCLYETLTGRRLYKFKEPAEALRAIVQDPVPSARAVDGGVPPELDAIMQRTLQKSPANRLPSCGHVQQALEAFINKTGGPVSPFELRMLMDKLFDSSERSPLTEHSAKLTGSFPANTGSMSLATGVQRASLPPSRTSQRPSQPTVASGPRRKPSGARATPPPPPPKKKSNTVLWASAACVLLALNLVVLWYLFLRD